MQFHARAAALKVRYTYDFEDEVLHGRVEQSRRHTTCKVCLPRQHDNEHALPRLLVDEWSACCRCRCTNLSTGLINHTQR